MHNNNSPQSNGVSASNFHIPINFYISQSKHQIDDVINFIEKNFSIKTENGEIPFKLYEYQKNQLIAPFITNTNCIVNSARQMGISWTLAAYALYYAYCVPGAKIEIYCYNNKQVNKFYDKLLYLFDSKRRKEFIAEFGHRPRLDEIIEYNNIEARKDIDSMYLYETGSTIDVLTYNADVFWERKNETIDLLISDNAMMEFSLSDDYDGKNNDEIKINSCIFTKTGFSNDAKIYNRKSFDTMFEKAQRGEVNAFPVMIGWEAHPSRTDDWAKKQIDRLGVATFTNEYCVPSYKAIDTELEELFYEKENIRSYSKTNGIMSTGGMDGGKSNLYLGETLIASDVKVVNEELFMRFITQYNTWIREKKEVGKFNIDAQAFADKAIQYLEHKKQSKKFNIEIGNLSDEQASKHLDDVMAEIKRVPLTQKIIDDCLHSNAKEFADKYHPLKSGEDIVIPPKQSVSLTGLNYSTTTKPTYITGDYVFDGTVIFNGGIPGPIAKREHSRSTESSGSSGLSGISGMLPPIDLSDYVLAKRT